MLFVVRLRPQYFWLLLLLAFAARSQAEETWPEYLGPGGLGHACAPGGRTVPLEWSERDNVVWKTAVPGRGWSSPVVADGQIWLTTAPEDGRTRSALCYDLKSGKIIHDLLLFRVAEVEKCNRFNSFASPTPVIDGKYVYVHFGAVGTVCLDRTTGSERWRRDDFKWLPFEGFGSSPTIYRNLLILTCDGGDLQFLIALDKTTGKTVWKTKRSVDFRDDPLIVRKGFCSSTVVAFEGRDYLLSEAARAAYAYDPETGREIWRFEFPCEAQTGTMRPRLWKNRVVVNSGYQKAILFAVDIRSQGVVRNDQVFWENDRHIAACPTPVVVGDHLYGHDCKGTIYCISLETGKTCWRQRVGGNHWASPVHQSGRIYFFDDKGKTTVIAADPKQYRVLAVNRLENGCMGTPAFLGETLVVRTKTDLYRIEVPTTGSNGQAIVSNSQVIAKSR